MSLEKQSNVGMLAWIKSGEPMIWLNAAAVSLSLIAVVGLIAVLAVKGLSHFWPADIVVAEYHDPQTDQTYPLMGEFVESTQVSIAQLRSAGLVIDTDQAIVERHLLKVGNRDVSGADFKWVVDLAMSKQTYPPTAAVLERREWGNFYGYLKAVKEQGKLIIEGDNSSAWAELQTRISRAEKLHQQIIALEKSDIGSINYSIEKLRLAQRSIELDQSLSPEQAAQAQADITAETKALNAEYESINADRIALIEAEQRDSAVFVTVDGREVDINLAKIVRAEQPNRLSVVEKMAVYGSKLWEFLSDDPREANTEGGIFPAIFGTVMMVLLMSILVTPFGVIAAVYLREYAKQGLVIRIVRIAVNNLAGVPSIVYGVFGLGFFIYYMGSGIDQAFYQEALPAPTFGTPGLMWASLTLALLTLPVVIVATEEGLARIPRSVREGSLALGATKAETLWRVVIPMASPAMMTGLILAVARAAGEVAPLMLVGVVKLAPSLPMDLNAPFIHLERKFMHLGFHIYDVGFQSPNVEAARPLVYATALLLVIVIALLNMSAVTIRNRLREKYKALES